MKPFLVLIIINIIFFVNSENTTNTTTPTETNTTTPTETNSTTPTETNSTTPTETNTTTPTETSSTTPTETSSTTPTETSSTTPTETSSTTPTATSSTTPSSTNSTSSTTPSTTETLADKILLGFDNYNYNQASKVLSFFTYIRNTIERPTRELIFRLGLTRNLRRLEEEEITCNLINEDNKEQIYKYNCTLENVTSGFSKVQIYTDMEKTKLAEEMGQNLQIATGDKFSEQGIIIMKECNIEEINNNNNIQITGKNDTSLDKGDLTLYVVQNNGNIENVPTTLNYKDNKAKMVLRPRRSIHTDSLDGTLGKIKGGKNVFLSFSGSNSTVSYDAPSNNIYRKRRSNGLSTGGIIAIIIPCVLVLLAVAAVAFFLGRKTPDPQTQNLTNAAGINSSTNIVN